MCSSDDSSPGRRGRFITLEGGEGAGKSTQLQVLAARLEAARREVLTTREPGGTPKAEALREALLSGTIARFGPLAEAIAFSAARIDHVEATIAPALRRGVTVICDRFIDSTRAYQGAAGQVDPALIDALERVAVGDLMPDLTIVLDLPSDVGAARAAARRGRTAAPDRFEAQDRAFHDSLRRAFLDIATRDHVRCCVVDASRSSPVVADQIWHVVTARLFPDLGHGAH